MWHATTPRFITFVAATLMSLIVGQALLHAGVTDHLFLPLPGKRIRNNARLEMESRWVTGNGYRPVKVTVVNMPPGPTKFDRDFRVRLTPHGYYGQSATVQTEAIIEMPEGATQGSAWIAVPQVQGWQNIDIEVREGGQRIEELSQRSMQLNANMNYAGANAFNEAMPCVLFIDSDTPLPPLRDSQVSQFRSTGTSSVTQPSFNLPDIRMWQNLVPHANDPWNRNSMTAAIAPGVGRANDVEILTLVSQNPKIDILHPSELPDQWLHYTCLDLIVISLPDAQQMAKKQPTQWRALREWAASGATLVITDVGEKFKQVEAVQELANLPDESVREGDLEGHGGWVVAKTEFASGRVRAVDTAVQSSGYIDPNTGMPINNTVTPVSVDARKPPFAIHTLGLGRIVAWAKPEVLENPPHELAWCLNQLDGRNWMNYQRHGVSFVRQNNDFMTFMIEGTGRVPVWSFLVLITAFVVVIGPVNYVLLKRWRRLFLLLVTVPFGAAVITISLFTYAIASDGFGVRVRARSYTRLDQRTGDVAVWSRQAYYAGLAPSGGLKFPADSAVYPIEERPWGGRNRLREIAWEDDVQQLRSGYISSRQTSQYLVIRNGNSKRKLVIKSPTRGGAPTVVNQLEADIEHLVVRDKAGNYYVGSEISAGEEMLLSPPAVSDKSIGGVNQQFLAAIKPFSVAYNDRRPSAPLGYQTDGNSGGLFGFTSYRRNVYYYDQGYDRGLPTPSFSSSILERELQKASNNSSSEMDPGSYLALLETSPEMPHGYGRVKEQGSFHMLEGRW